MALVTWDQSFSVNVKRLDEQHQKLCSLINSLHEAMRQGKGQEVVLGLAERPRRAIEARQKRGSRLNRG